VLRKVFDTFDHNKKGSIPSSMVRTIFTVMGHRVDDVLLKAIIQEVDADGESLQ
jgi:Ca2+-binding EF-hand superfamily protein